MYAFAAVAVVHKCSTLLVHQYLLDNSYTQGGCFNFMILNRDKFLLTPTSTTTLRVFHNDP